MKRTALCLALVGLLGASGCTTENHYGECVGLLTEDERNPKMEYRVKKMNIFWAIVFSETLFVPVLVGGFWVYCPMGPKAP